MYSRRLGLAILFLSVLSMGAQKKEESPQLQGAYLRLALNTGSLRSSGDFNISLIFKGGHQFEFTAMAGSRNSPSATRADCFECGVLPPDVYRSLGLSYGRSVEIDRNVRWVTSFGLAMAKMNEPVNVKPDYHSGGFFLGGPSYDYELVEHEFLTGTLHSRLEVHIGRIIGLSVQGTVHLNEFMPFATIGGGLIIGYVKPKRR